MMTMLSRSTVFLNISLPRSIKNVGFLNLQHVRCLSSSKDILKEKLESIIPKVKEDIAAFRKEYGSYVVDKITVDQIYSGMRGIRGLIYENSLLDPVEGIRFRGLSLPEVRDKLPKLASNEEPLPEGIFWLLLTNEFPTLDEVKWLSGEWARRSHVDSYVDRLIQCTPKTLHPMTQLSMIVTSLNEHSAFARGYNDGSMKKSDMWKFMYEDCMDLIAKIPVIAAKIYCHNYDKTPKAYDKSKDWSHNMAFMHGIDDDLFTNYLRVYMIAHSDHEGGNVSAHTTRLVGSALSDVFLSYGAGISGLAGPLHGRASQEVMTWIDKLIKDIGVEVSDEILVAYIEESLKTGVIPGFGHAVLRKTDPRYTLQSEFAQQHFPDVPTMKLAKQLFRLVPPILGKTGKVKNPWPNVDGHSGIMFKHFGVTEAEYYTVFFAVSRTLGICPGMIWDRAMMYPIERPKSVTTQCLKETVNAGITFTPPPK